MCTSHQFSRILDAASLDSFTFFFTLSLCSLECVVFISSSLNVYFPSYPYLNIVQYNNIKHLKSYNQFEIESLKIH